MPYDDQNNYYDNQNQNTNSSQILTQTQQTQADANKGGYDPNNPNNNLYGDREATNPFFVFTFIKEFLEYFKNLANRIVEKKDYKDGLKSGKAYREKKEDREAEKEKKKKERQAKKETKKAKRNQDGDRQEDITSPSPFPKSNEFSMFKREDQKKPITPGKDGQAAEQARKQAKRQAENDRKLQEANEKKHKGWKVPKRTINSKQGGK